MSASSVEKIPHGEAPNDSTTMTIPSRPSIDGENEKPKHRREDSTVSSHDDDTHSDTHSSLGSMEEIAAEDVENAPATRTKSRSSSVRSKAVTIIERQHRRGLLGQFSYIPEVTRPVEYTRRTKWIITMTVALAAAAAPQGSAIFFPVLPQIADEFNTTATVTNLSVALYMLSMSIFPLWWSSYSETLGRRTIYLYSFLLFFVSSIASALAPSIATLIFFRVVSGGSAAGVQAVGAGTIADMWDSFERGRAMGIFYLGPLMGPLFAPIIGGAMGQAYGWRSTQWFLTAYGGLILILIVLCVPETLARPPTPVRPPQVATEAEPVKNEAAPTLTRVSTRQSIKKHTWTFAKLNYRFWVEPLKPLLYLRFPAVAIIVYYAAVTFGALYVLNISIQATFSVPPYNFSTLVVGLLYIPSALGYMIASPIGGKWCDYIMIREARNVGRFRPGTDGSNRSDLILLPEDRMCENAYIAAVMYPLGLIVYGWTADRGIHWIVPCIANFFFGLGSMVIFSVATTMLTEFMPKRSSSGVAVNNFVRNIFACIGGVVGQDLVEALGDGWLFTIMGLWALSSGFVVFAMRRWAPKWRAEMNEKLG